MEKKALYMPSDLIIEILVKLPVKSLLRFKLVCKLWFSFISNPNFANSNFQLTQTHTRRILSISSVSPLKFRSIDFEPSSSSSLNHEFTSRTLNLNPLPLPLQIRGSCRGFLFLYHNDSKFSFWNPSTGFQRLMRFSLSHSETFSCFTRLYGFGYDQSRDDYLLVIFYYKCHPFLSHYSEFFSLRDNTWTKIEVTHYPCRNLYYIPILGTLFFNGAIHWLGFSNDLMLDVILVFDLMEKKMLEMRLPDDLNQFCTKCNLWVFGEFLSLWTLSDGIVEIWVMKNYKVHSSWTKTLVLPVPKIPYFYPICSTKNGDIIGTNNTKLVKYSGKGKVLEECSDTYQPVMYTETLLSLPE